MTGEPGPTDAPRPLGDESTQGQNFFELGEPERDALLAWVGENLTLVRRTASGQRVMTWILGFGFVVGLAAHISGFLLKTSAPAEPLSLVADLLYQLGLALWTGVVVAMFVQFWPEVKRRHYKQALDAYEDAANRKAQAGRNQVPDQPDAQGK